MRNRRRYKTARCILHRPTEDAASPAAEREYLLAVHASFRYRRRPRWGLVGGAVEWREDPHRAALREVDEELGIQLSDALSVGAYDYKQSSHLVVAAEWRGDIPRIDDSELMHVRWFNTQGVETLAAERSLHAGYEWQAIQHLHALLAGHSGIAGPFDESVGV
ncbi:MAG: NUDIX hydrolase [Pseudomonadota bacterium]